MQKYDLDDARDRQISKFYSNGLKVFTYQSGWKCLILINGPNNIQMMKIIP